MLQRTWDAGIGATWVTGDTVYGSNPPLRTALETRRQAYALAISCQEQVDVSGRRTRVMISPRKERIRSGSDTV
jgi:SRSO17 transposase